MKVKEFMLLLLEGRPPLLLGLGMYLAVQLRFFAASCSMFIGCAKKGKEESGQMRGDKNICLQQMESGSLRIQRDSMIN